MKPATKTLITALAGLLAPFLALLPLRADAGPAECGNATTSLASLVNDPTTGDEAFFKLPTGPANVMLLLDTSGSMSQFPQCGDTVWDDADAPVYCQSPIIARPADPVAPATFRVTGTCAPWVASAGVTANANLSWMQRCATAPAGQPCVTSNRAYPDPGRQNAILNDNPPWGTGCTGDACMFDPDAYYLYGDWPIDDTTHVSTATRRAHETAAGMTRACIALDANGNAIRDVNNNTIDLGAGCRACMGAAGDGTDGAGFYFYRVRYRNQAGILTTTPSPASILWRGTFLNGNSPKFVSARKVVKDLAWMDPTLPNKLDQVRQGLSVLCTDSLQHPHPECRGGAGGTNRRATLIVPLGPNKTDAFPATQAAFVQPRQTILDVINDRIAGHFHAAETATPLASALFNVGQYFSTPGLYTSSFGASFEIAAFRETAAGTVNAPWAQAGSPQCSVCWACQTNSVILVTDGAPNSEITLPATVRNYDTTTYTSAANCGAAGALCFGADPAPRVASWEHNTDLRTELALGAKQAITVHTVGFNLLEPTAIRVLQATANMGSGSFQNAKDARSLSDAVFNALNTVIQKENSFSAASASSLQTVQTASAEAFLTRFKPNDTATWEGHVFRGAFFDEFLNGCDPSKAPALQPNVQCAGKTVSASFNGVVDAVTGNALCTGVYLIDSDCDEVAEDVTTGDFVKKGQALPANFPWDAGAVLSTTTKPGYRSADETAGNARNIFTWLNGVKVPFTTANVATLKPFLNIDPTWCTAFLTQIGVAGGADPTSECARQVIHFVRGWDVTNNDLDSCWGPNNPKNVAGCPSGLKGEERNRANDSRTTGNPVFWKLGDVFHSSPSVVSPPIDEIRCDTGYEKQCVATLHSPQVLPHQTPIASYTVAGKTVDAYESWRIAQSQRKRVVLVGANDGMLHAFDAGDADTSQPQDPTGAWQYTAGTGEELWAFIPPDLLPRLRGLLSNHQYMVDGSVMVRDVWRDFNDDMQKQDTEYRTVAIVGERTGGTQYTALDVTVPTSPTFLWSFPPPASGDAMYMGESWMDFAPRPPPMGPVKIASNRDPRGFEERWIAMINGGYDPAFALGRAVWMLDVWTGRVLWRFTDDDFKAAMGFGSGTSMFPVPAGIGLVDIGDTTAANMDSDGFFDTATWGDMGGNLWVARFQQPGVIPDPANPASRVSNWFAARTFEEQRRTDDLQGVAGRNEFFYMTANAFEPTTRTLRTYLGTANRERMMDSTATCSTDNLMGCCRVGCSTVTSSTNYDFGACSDRASFACQNGTYQLPRIDLASTCGAAATCAAPPGNKFTAAVNVSMSCPGNVPKAVSGQVTCDANGVCTSTPVGLVEVGSSSFTAPPRNRFFGIWSYGRDTAKMFDSQATAQAFDRNRFTDGTYSGTCTGPSGGTCTLLDTTLAGTTLSFTTGQVTNACPGGVARCVANVDDPGWMFEYGDSCPLQSCTPPPPWNDEKTGSSANVILGCTSWAGFRPVGGSTSTDPCSGTLGVPVSYGYLSHYVSGTPTPNCGYVSSGGGVYRAGQRSTTAPPSGGMVRVTISPDGKIAYSTLSFDAGAPPGSKQLQVRTEIGEPVYWLEVSRSLHNCRHANAGSCD
jgi:hypothetical protein